MVFPDTGWNVCRTPTAVYASGTLHTSKSQLEPLVTNKDDLPVILDSLHIRPIVIQTHVSHKQHLPPIKITRPRAIDLCTCWCCALPDPIEAHCSVFSLEH